AFTEVRWNSGTTEPGSSGSGLWTFDGSQYLLRGGLWGGTALCDNPSGTDNFSPFTKAYPALATYLSTAKAAIDYTDMWYNPNESGWGLNVIQHPSQKIFGVWFTYRSTGRPTWYVLPDGVWTSSNVYSGTLSATVVTYLPDLGLFERSLASLAAAIGVARAAGLISEAVLYIVDNGPAESVAAVRDAARAFPPAVGRVEFVHGHGNVGYGRANNL